MPETVIIKWRDSVHRDGWHHPDDLRGWCGQVITTVGFLVSETDDDVVIAQSKGGVDGDPVFCNVMSIPRVCIVERE